MARRDRSGRENHLRPLLLTHLKLLPTRGAQEVLAVRVPEHVEAQLVRAAEGLVALRALVDLF